MKNLAPRVGKGLLLTIVLSLSVGFWAVMVPCPAGAEQTAKYYGILADVLCATRGTALDGADMMKHPEKHTVACLKEPPCVASGYGILTKGQDESYTFHKFDKKGNELASELIKKTPKKDQLWVDVTGQTKDGILSVDHIAEK